MAGLIEEIDEACVEINIDRTQSKESQRALSTCVNVSVLELTSLPKITEHCRRFPSSLQIVQPPYMLYMGEEKHENEELIRWGWPEDVWFHVDKVSSAHVYLRLHQGENLEDLSEAVIDDCAQLVKANSINGNKMNNVDVVYTMWSNLKKTPKMDVGQVGFHKEKDVKKVRVEKRINEIVNRLNKTKKEIHPDLREQREDRDRKEREKEKNLQHERKLKEKEEERDRKEQAELRSYSTLMNSDNMKTNIDGGNESDEFM